MTFDLDQTKCRGCPASKKRVNAFDEAGAPNYREGQRYPPMAQLH